MIDNCIYYSIVKKNDINISDTVFPNYINRDESKKAYSLLFKMFNYLGISINIKDIYISDNGKPFIKNSNIKFNYSHSNNYIACAIAMCDVGIDIEDEFEISDKARGLYLKGIKEDYRGAWVKKEAYCKMIGDFDDNFFKNLKISSNDYYEEVTSLYHCVLFYKDKNIKVKKIMLELM